MPVPVTDFTMVKSLSSTLRIPLRWSLFCAVAVVQAQRTAAPSAVLAVTMFNPTGSGAAPSSKTPGRMACSELPYLSALLMNVVEFSVIFKTV